MDSTRNCIRLLCAAAFAVAPCSGWAFTASSELGAVIAAREATLVAFVLPELETCKKLEPQWALVQEREQAAATVDCSAEPEYCLTQDVHTHPAVRIYFPDDAYRRYRGPRKADEILSFFKRSRQRTRLSTVSDDTLFLDSDDVTVLGTFPAPNEENAMLHEVFKDVAYRYGDRFSFGLRTVAEGAPFSMTCRNNRDGLAYEESDLSRVSAVEAFVKKCGTPLVEELTRRNEMSLMEMGKSMVHYFPTSEADKASFTAMIRPLAKKYHEYLTFLTTDSDEYPDSPPSLGHRRGAKGVLAVQNPHTRQAFPLDEGVDITAEGVEEFIVAITQGKAAAWDGRPRAEGEKEGGNRGEEGDEDRQEGHDEL